MDKIKIIWKAQQQQTFGDGSYCFSNVIDWTGIFVWSISIIIISKSLKWKKKDQTPFWEERDKSAFPFGGICF